MWLNGLWNLLWIILITLPMKCNLNVFYTRSASERTVPHLTSALVHSHYIQRNCSVHFFIHYIKALWFCRILTLPGSITPVELQMSVRIGHNLFTTSLHSLILLLMLLVRPVVCQTLSKNAFEFSAAQDLILFPFFLLLWPLSPSLSVVSITL